MTTSKASVQSRKGLHRMSGHDEIGRATRLRIAGNLRELKDKHGFTTDAAMAKALGMSRGVVNRALKGERTVGLDFLLAVNRAFPDVSIDDLCKREPAAGQETEQRYSQARVAAEVTRVIKGRERGTHVVIARVLGMTSQQLSHRCSGAYEFSLEELGKIADFLAAPPGWPFIPWDESRRSGR